MTINEAEIRKTITIMKPEKELFEVRIIFSGGTNASGYFTDAETLIKTLKCYHASGTSNIYITLNGIKDECYSRQQRDQFIKNAKPTTTDSDIYCYDWLMVDIDPQRSAGTSSNNDQIEIAKTKGNEVYAFLKRNGFEEPIVAFSGNGVHLLYRIGLKMNEENKKLVKDCLSVLDLFFSDNYVKVDTANFNPARICKLYGTMAQKGANTEDRPHRMSYVIRSLEKPTQNGKALLEKLASYLPKPEKPHRYNNYAPGQFNLDEWLDRYGIRYTKTSYESAVKYILDKCPFDESHSGKDACIFKASNGAIGFHCFHNSCSNKTWQDVRRLFEPDAYDHHYIQERAYPNYRNPNYTIEKVEEVKMVDGQPVFFTTEQIRLLKEPPEEFIKTGIEVIDKKMRGLKKGFVSCLSGLRASGKSSIISQVTIEAAEQGYRTALFSGELKPKNLLKWLQLQAAGKQHVYQTQYESYYVVRSPFDELISKWLDQKVWVYNNYYGNNFTSIMEQIKKCVTDHKVDLVILDNMMALNLMEMGTDKYQQQSHFVECLENYAKLSNIHILFVAHPRKSTGFLRLDDVSGSNDIVNRVDNAFILHRVNEDFKRLSKDMFKWKQDNPLYFSSNVIEICKDRDGGVQDEFVPLYFEASTKRLRNSPGENKIYGWEGNGVFEAVPPSEQLPFE